jgi:hypothetical protein
MSDNTNTGQQPPATYQIQVQGELGPRWLHWFDDLAITAEPGDDGTTITTLTGPVPDQAGLRGILNKLWDLNLTILSINHTGPSSQHHEQTSDSVPQELGDSVSQRSGDSVNQPRRVPK